MLTDADFTRAAWAYTDAARSSMTPRDVQRELVAEVRAAIGLIRAPSTTTAELQALAVELRAVVRDLTRQRAAAESAEPPGLALASYRWTVAGTLAGILGMLIALLALVQDRIEADQPESPPSVTVVVEQPDAGEIARQVDERLRVIEQQRHVEQQRQAEHTDDDSDANGQNRRGADR